MSSNVKIAKELIRIAKELVFTENDINLEKNLDMNKKYIYNGEKMNMLGLFNEYKHVDRSEGILKTSFTNWLNQQVKNGKLTN